MAGANKAMMKAQQELSDHQDHYSDLAAEAIAPLCCADGVAGALGRHGFGVVGSFALSGATSSVSSRGVQDVGIK